MTEKKLWEVFSVFIRLRDTDENGFGKCFTCPRWIFWKNGDAGHGIPRQHKATMFDEKNNHLQCKHCNGFQGGKREVYKEEMDKRYGAQTWELMELKSKQRFHWGQFEFSAMIKHYKQEIEKLLKGKMIDIK